MRSASECDVTVIVPFADDEERVGTLGRRIAEHLHALGVSFEILAVDEGGDDNSVSLLSLVHASVP